MFLLTQKMYFITIRPIERKKKGNLYYIHIDKICTLHNKIQLNKFTKLLVSKLIVLRLKVFVFSHNINY